MKISIVAAGGVPRAYPPIPSDKSRLPIGSVVVYYNRWTGWDNEEVRGLFRQATEDQLRHLTPGDTIWIDIDPLHPAGKVYGYVKGIVVSVRQTSKGTEVGYDCPNERGTSANKGKFAIATDEDLLAHFVRNHPMASQT